MIQLITELSTEIFANVIPFTKKRMEYVWNQLQLSAQKDFWRIVRLDFATKSVEMGNILNLNVMMETSKMEMDVHQHVLYKLTTSVYQEVLLLDLSVLLLEKLNLRF